MCVCARHKAQNNNLIRSLTTTTTTTTTREEGNMVISGASTLSLAKGRKREKFATHVGDFINSMLSFFFERR